MEIKDANRMPNEKLLDEYLNKLKADVQFPSGVNHVGLFVGMVFHHEVEDGGLIPLGVEGMSDNLSILDYMLLIRSLLRDARDSLDREPDSVNKRLQIEATLRIEAELHLEGAGDFTHHSVDLTPGSEPEPEVEATEFPASHVEHDKPIDNAMRKATGSPLEG